MEVRNAAFFGGEHVHEDVQRIIKVPIRKGRHGAAFCHTMNRALWKDSTAAALLAALVVLLYRKVTRLWWMWDDPFHINLLGARSFRSILFGGDLWRNFTAHVFTPLFFVSMKTDLVLFGANARRFYEHDLIAVAAVAILFYAMMRQWVDPVPAFCSAALAVTAPPVAFAITQTLARHYFEGAALALIAVIAFVRGWPWLSALAYFLAMGEKEVYVPLIVILACIPKRARMVVPHAIALAVYAIWRLTLTGLSLRGYGFTVRASEWPVVLATLPWRLAKQWVGHAGVAGVVLVVAVVVGVIAVAARKPLFAIIAFLCALLPVAPVAVEMQARYAIPAWLIASAALAFLPRARVILPIVMAIALVANRAEWAQTIRDAKRMSDEARVFAAMRAGDLLYMPMTPPATIAELAGMTKSPGRWSYDELPLCAGRLQASRFFTFDRGAVIEALPATLSSDCTLIRRAPLEVRFQHQGDALFWQFGPYHDGRYRVVLYDGIQGFDVPPHIGYRVPEIHALRVRVRYDSPQGWAAYSPDLDLKW
jgi:hypothetical protein